MSYELDKKRLLYNKSEDLYFIAYNILLILYKLGCNNKANQFKDYRKLAFLIPIISDSTTTRLVTDYYDNKNEPNFNIKNSLNKLYFKSIENIILIRYVLIILEQKGIITIESEEDKTNVYFNDYKKHIEFCENNIFKEEIKNIAELKLNIYKLRTLKYITFIDKVFKKNGVVVWEV